MKAGALTSRFSSVRPPRDALLAGLALVLVTALLVGFALVGKRGPAECAGVCLAVESPLEEAPVLDPVVVRVKGHAATGSDGAQISFHPPAPGTTAWEGADRLVFRPDWPGFARGVSYEASVKVPGRGGIPGASTTFTLTTAGRLAVQSVFPERDSGEVPVDAAVFVQFNRSVAPLGDVHAQESREVLAFDPPATGEGRWLNTSLYTFRPAAGWQPATHYTATVRRGLTNLLGGTLQEDYAWSFATIMPAVAEVAPADQTKYVSSDGVRTIFNQAVNQADAQASFSLTDTSDGSLVGGSFEWPDDHTLVFHPAASLRANTLFRATVGAGVRAAAGQAATGAPFTWSFNSVDVPHVVSSSPPDGATAAARYGVTVVFSNPMDVDSVEKEVSLEPGPEYEDKWQFYWEQPANTVLHIGGTLKASTTYTLKVNGGNDRYGTPLSAPYQATFTAAPMEPGFSIYRPMRTGTFDAYVPPVITSRSWNMGQLDFSLYRVGRDTLIKLDASPSPSYQLDTQAPGDVVNEWSISIPDPPLDTPVTNQSTLTERDGSALAPGYYVLDVSGPGDPVHSRLTIVISRSHATLKLSDSEALVWVVDMQTGDPVVGAPVTVIASDSTTLGSGVTGSDGVAALPVTLPEAWSNQPRYMWPAQGSLYAVVDRPGDTVLVSNGWTQGIDVWDFRLPQDYWATKHMVANVYTDRPIYRPGETVYYRGVIRTDDDTRYGIPPSDPGAVININDTNGNNLRVESVVLDEYGAFSGALALSADASTGNYYISLQRTPTPSIPSGDWLFSVPFQVAEFKRPEFQVGVTLDKPSYVNGETGQATAAADFYFGMPLANADLKWQVWASDYYFQPEKYPGYSFSELDRWYRYDWGREQNKVLTQGAGTTGADGKFSFSFPADISSDPVSQRFSVQATVTDENNGQVANDVEVIVHKGRFYVGLRPESYVQTAGSPTNVVLVTLDPDSNPVPNVPLKVSVYRRRWLAVKEQDAEGDQVYKSEPEDTLEQTVEGQTGPDGEGAVSFTPQQSGEYRLVAEGTDDVGNTIRAGVSTYVSGGTFAAWYVENNDRIEVVADKDLYQPGDVAKVLVASPIDGARGLVTIERGHIIDHAVRDFAGNSTTLEIPVEDRYIPDVFISVVLFKPPTAGNPLPSVKFGYVELKVDNDSRRLRIDITPDRDAYQPGDNATFTIRTTDAAGRGVPAEMSLALVDKAIRALATDQTAPGMEAFWKERGLGVRTGDTFAASIDRANQLAIVPAGGKGGSGGGSEEDAPRRDFPNTAYWDASFRTDASGQGSVTVKLPDTLTTWHLAARAMTADSLAGDQEQEIVVRKPLMLRPALPRFLVVGDRARLQVAVHNQTGADATVRVALLAQGVAVESAGLQSVQVPAGESAPVAWDVIAIPGDTASFRFDGSADGGATDSLELSLPVHDYITPEVAGTAGEVIDEAAEVVQVPSYARTDRGELTVRVEPSVADGMQGSLQYLQAYPYESADDTVNRFLPRLVLQQAIRDLGLQDAPDPGVDVGSLVGQSLQRLYSVQHVDGGWGWFVEDGSDPLITAYVLAGLGEAQRDGYTVDGGALSRAAGYLTGQMNLYYDVASPLPPDRRAYMLYGLAAAGMPDTGRVLALAEQPESLGNAGKAWALLALQAAGYPLNDPRAQALVTALTNDAVTSATGAHWEEQSYDPQLMSTSVVSTAAVLQALAAAAPDHPLVDGAVRWLLVARKSDTDTWSSTKETSAALMGLTAVLRARGEAQGDYDYAVGLNGEERLAGHADAGRLSQGKTLVVQLAELAAGQVNELGLRRTPAQAAGRLYYTAHLRYWTPAQGIEAASQGVAVSHEYFPADGDTPGLQATLGDLVRVKVTLVAPSELNYLLLEDFLPAGLEAVDASLKVTPQEIRDRMEEEALKSRKALAGRFDPRCGGRCGYVGYSPFSHVDVRDDRVALFARFVPRGTYEYTYFARATTAGTFAVPPAQAAEKYFPEVWGRSDGETFEVTGSEVQPEALTAQGDNEAPAAGRGRQSFADAADQGVKRLLGDARDVGARPDAGDEVLAAANPTAVLEQAGQQPELLGGERRDQFAAFDVDTPGAGVNTERRRWLRGGRLWDRRRRRPPRPPYHKRGGRKRDQPEADRHADRQGQQEREARPGPGTDRPRALL